MKIEAPIEKITEAITKAEKVTGKNLSLPVLKCVLLDVTDGKLSVRATDLEVGIEVHLAVKVEKDGKVAVPADVFRSFLSQIPNGSKVALETDEGTLRVETDTLSTKVKTLSSDEFPSIPQSEGASSITLPATVLREGLESVWYAASPSSMKPELSSVYVYHDDGDLVFVATDSFRLAEKRVAVEDIESFDSILIPHENVAQITRIFSKSDEDITLHIGDNQIAFQSDDTYVTSRIIDGKFPDYRQIIPDSQSTTVTVLKEDFSEMLKLSTIFSDKFNKLSINVEPETNSFTLKTQNSDVGENESKLAAKTEGADIGMNFNHRYITDCLSVIKNESLKLTFGPGHPMVIRGVGDESFLYLVMPMNK